MQPTPGAWFVNLTGHPVLGIYHHAQYSLVHDLGKSLGLPRSPKWPKHHPRTTVRCILVEYQGDSTKESWLTESDL
jgi:hypothetical protein